MIHDISPPISPALAVWPGDTPPSREVLLDMRSGANLTLSTLHGSVHLGAHADAPSHHGADAPAIDASPLDLYVGPCQVIAIDVARNESIHPASLRGSTIEAERVLFRTGTYPDPTVFSEDFASLSPELIDHLHASRVRLVGIDTPSVDPFRSSDLPAHRACLLHDMAILEGLVLDRVQPGHYELIALPLRLVGFDASPVRAVLRELPRGSRQAGENPREDAPHHLRAR